MGRRISNKTVVISLWIVVLFSIGASIDQIFRQINHKPRTIQKTVSHLDGLNDVELAIGLIIQESTVFVDPKVRSEFINVFSTIKSDLPQTVTKKTLHSEFQVIKKKIAQQNQGQEEYVSKSTDLFVDLLYVGIIVSSIREKNIYNATIEFIGKMSMFLDKRLVNYIGPYEYFLDWFNQENLEKIAEYNGKTINPDIIDKIIKSLKFLKSQ